MEYIGNILYDESLLEADGKLIIFGAGVYGQRVLRYLEVNGVKNRVICFCDSDEKLEGKKFEGIQVCSVKETCLRYPDANYLVSGRYSREMYQMLKELDIRKIHILFI